MFLHCTFICVYYIIYSCLNSERRLKLRLESNQHQNQTKNPKKTSNSNWNSLPNYYKKWIAFPKSHLNTETKLDTRKRKRAISHRDTSMELYRPLCDRPGCHKPDPTYYDYHNWIIFHGYLQKLHFQRIGFVASRRSWVFREPKNNHLTRHQLRTIFFYDFCHHH